MKMISAVSCHVLHLKLFHMSQSRVCKVAECDVVNRNCMRHTHWHERLGERDFHFGILRDSDCQHHLIVIDGERLTLRRQTHGVI